MTIVFRYTIYSVDYAKMWIYQLEEETDTKDTRVWTLYRDSVEATHDFTFEDICGVKGSWVKPTFLNISNDENSIIIDFRADLPIESKLTPGYKWVKLDQG